MIIPPGYAQVNLIWTGTALPSGAQCTLGLDNQTPNFSAADLAQNVIDAYVTAGFASNLPNDVNLVGVLAKKGPNATGESALVSTGQNSGGGTAGTPNTAVLVHKNTPLGGRAGRGRMYLPSIQEDQVGPSGIIAPAVVAALQSDMDTFQSELVAVDLDCVVLHNAGSPLETPTPITTFTVQSIAATQRRRLRR